MTEEADFLRLTDAEDYFHFFRLPYDPLVLGAKRLHILRRYGELLAEIDEKFGSRPWPERRILYRDALSRAYEELAGQTPQEAALFSVFRARESKGSGCGGCIASCAVPVDGCRMKG